MVAITGNTYPVKDQLKALGARWNPDKKTWMVEESKADQARKIVSGAPLEHKSNRRFNSGRFECDDCGDLVYHRTRCWETGLTH